MDSPCRFQRVHQMLALSRPQFDPVGFIMGPYSDGFCYFRTPHSNDLSKCCSCGYPYVHRVPLESGHFSSHVCFPPPDNPNQGRPSQSNALQSAAAYDPIYGMQSGLQDSTRIGSLPYRLERHTEGLCFNQRERRTESLPYYQPERRTESLPYYQPERRAEGLSYNQRYQPGRFSTRPDSFLQLSYEKRRN
ncbi:hypothetical protein CDAR_248251 [Caerostris darwini]|uniref:Uncharacterized protein n=1 Tax=Caerostris darwini TaxID=1538125 RepID=A0AAV4WA08_9ARAC|nr:hypothetical protein CDAR_248251 [Caerostris darwini]